VALAGPAVNVVIAAALFAWLALTRSLEPLSRLAVTEGSFLERLLVVNVFLVLFNMLPAFPMDGGRVVRALLATRLEYTKATHIAALLGQGMAYLFGFIPFTIVRCSSPSSGSSGGEAVTQMKSPGRHPSSRAMWRTSRPSAGDRCPRRWRGSGGFSTISRSWKATRWWC
jgi:membrane-associated protease RseP (regulator of RpoE activity)